ncbi:MAG: ISAs1 family transposase, partial [Deltaproteobacteria bacterium]|nr:ISAs1 family transposase [Deltaproteobacteria bacterium]
MFEKLVKIFKSIPDPRVQGRTKHQLWHMLTIAFMAIMAGSHGWKDIHSYGVANFVFFEGLLLGFTEMPSVDTIARTLSTLDPASFCDMLLKLAKDFLRCGQDRGPGRPNKATPPVVISLDGKSVRGAVKPGEKKTKVHIVNTVCNQIVLFVMRVFEKSNEITVIPVILEKLHKCGLLKGKVVTADAMGCQKHIAEQIVGYRADYLFGLKGNHGTLLKDVQSVFNKGLLENEHEFDVGTYTSPADTISGRIETRAITVVYLTTQTIKGWITQMDEWAGIKAIIRVERHVDYPGERPTTIEVRYFITSLSLPPEQLLAITIEHWGVETVHGYLDDSETFAEDKCKIHRGNGAEILSVFRKLALNLLIPIKKMHDYAPSVKESVRTIIDLLNRSKDFLMEVLTKKPKDVTPPRQWR